MLQPPSPGSLVFVDFFAGGGGSTATAVTLDTVADESRKKMADGVARSPSRLCSRDGKICCYGDTSSTIFSLACFCALLPTFSFSFFFPFFSIFFPASRYDHFRVPSSVQQPSAYSQQVRTEHFIARVLSACVICTLPHLLSLIHI